LRFFAVQASIAAVNVLLYDVVIVVVNFDRDLEPAQLFVQRQLLRFRRRARALLLAVLGSEPALMRLPHRLAFAA